MSCWDTGWVSLMIYCHSLIGVVRRSQHPLKLCLAARYVVTWSCTGVTSLPS